MTEEKYNTKDIRHIDEKNQEYIAEGNRMTEGLHTYYCKDCFKKQEQIERLEQENKELRKANEISIEKVTVTAEAKRLQELEQENKELKQQHYEALKMLKHEYNGRQRDNEQWFKRCTENHNEDSKIIENYRSALEEIRNYCVRIEQGSVIGTQDCLINSIKNITNEVLNEKEL